jgi:hypothetical protein
MKQTDITKRKKTPHTAPSPQVDDDIVNGARLRTTPSPKSDSQTANLTINPDLESGIFTSKLTGMCLVPYPQGGNHAIGVSKEGITRSRCFLENGAVKLWFEPAPGGRADMLMDNYVRDVFSPDIFPESPRRSRKWEEFEELLKAIHPCDAYVLINHMPPNFKLEKEKARYRSDIDNNLDKFSTPTARAAQAAELLARWREITDDENAVLKLNLWNEPQFDTTGNWEAEDFARFAVDCAEKMRKTAPGAVPVVPLHMSDNSWNERLLANLAESKMAESFEICDHNYGFSWININKQYPGFDTYLSRMVDAARCDEKLAKDAALIEKFGKGKWKFSILEWNLHPEGYLGSFRAANDLASCFHQFNFIKSMSDHGVDAATFFQFQGMTHFSLAADENLRIQNPPFRLFEWLGRYAVGQTRIQVDVDSPTFKGPRRPFKEEGLANDAFSGEYEIPHISAMAFKNNDKLTIFILNTHPEQDIEISIETSGSAPIGKSCEIKTLTAEYPTPMPEAVKAHVAESIEKLEKGKISFKAPRHSLNVLLLT